MRTLVGSSGRLGTSVALGILGMLWADGGQGRARRNAWAAMVADSKRSRMRAEVTASMAEAGHPVAIAAVNS